MITLRLRFLSGICFILLAITCFAQTSTSQCGDTTFRVGTGIYDITGPPAQVGMMGYAMSNQLTTGIYQRLWARAFVIESPCNGKRIVFVNTDLAMIFQGLKDGVMQQLTTMYGDRYQEDNVLLTAIHSHSGPGGYADYALYNFSIPGFNKQNYNVIVNGIVKAIQRADNNLTPATIKFAYGDLPDVGFNRSPTAYLLNPPAERNRYSSNVDTRMFLVRFDNLKSQPLGMINWFAVHGVSLNNKNYFISGDNKGYAEYLFEREMKSDYGKQAFVAAFAQANEVDVSANQLGVEGGEGQAGKRAVEAAGGKQYLEAKALFKQANNLLTGSVNYRLQYVDMTKYIVNPEFTDLKQPYPTCPGAIGVSMLAGTTDGEGIGKQGISCDNITSVIPQLFCTLTTTACQGVKPIFFQTGSMLPYPWTANILPFQMFQIGQLVIVAAPVELSTMSGRRIRELVQQVFQGTNVQYVVISGLANSYAGYVVTPEEYTLQRYEGASTLFGPWTLSAMLQEYQLLATAIKNDTAVALGPHPLYLIDRQIDGPFEILFDDVPLGKNFGSVVKDVRKNYKPGDTVQVVFWGGHPNNDLYTQETYLKIQKLTNGQWQNIRTDNDWDVEYEWKRVGAAYSQIMITWNIPSDIGKGTYRIQNFGAWKSFLRGKITRYQGTSSSFTINK